MLFFKKHAIISRSHRGIVQLVEHQSPKLGVVGSSPSAPAKKPDKFRLVEFFIQAAGLVYHHDAVVDIISPLGCISSRASVYLACGLMIYNTSC